MAVVRIPSESVTMTDADAIIVYLKTRAGIDYERWNPSRPLRAEDGPEEILAAYSPEIERLKASGGYTVADVIDVNSGTPGLNEMLARFSREHLHEEDEVRFIIEGRGLFHVRPEQSPVIAIEVEAGDLIRVPAGTCHWFDLCADRMIRVIRLFTDPAGWVPRYTESGVDRQYEPACLGQTYAPRQLAAP
jgi:1,2-dihydroxy-3-keto-5-methylthiopentene dioxygenase